MKVRPPKIIRDGERTWTVGDARPILDRHHYMATGRLGTPCGYELGSSSQACGRWPDARLHLDWRSYLGWERL